MKLRKTPRRSEQWTLDYQLDALPQRTHTAEGCILNVAEGQLDFDSQQSLSVSERLSVELKSPRHDVPMLGLARVTFCKRQGKCYHIGADFWWVGLKSTAPADQSPA